MCWNLTVSATTAAVEFVFILLLVRRRSRYDHAVVPVLTSIFLVECMEMLQWVYLEPIESLRSHPNTCKLVNQVATRVILASVAAQPFLINRLLLVSCNQRHTKALFQFTTCAALLLWILYCTSMAMAEVWGFQTMSLESMKLQGFTSLWGHTTCGYPGPHGHLQWTFRISVHDLLPNPFPYFLLVSLPLVWHTPRHVVVVPIGFMLALFAVLLVAFEMNFGEACSVWCFSGLFGCVYYTMLPLWEPQAAKGEPAGPTRNHVLRMKEQ